MNPFLDQPNPFFSPDPRLMRAGALRGQAPQPQSIELQQRADELYAQGRASLNAPVDPSAQQAQMGRNQAGARRKLALALAAQQAGEEFGGLGGQFLKQSMELRQPLKVGNAGVVDPSGQYVEDPTFANQRRADTLLQQAQKYETLAQRAVAAEDRQRAQEAAQQARAEAQRLAAETRAQTLAIQQANLDLRREAQQDRTTANELRQRESRLQKERSIRGVEATAEYSLNAINRATSLLGNQTVGTVGELLRRLPGNQARDLQATLDTIKANIGFQALNEMRAASATGGALGQVTERELAFLQSTIASLDQSQTLQQFRQNLLTVQQHFERARAYAAEDRAALGAGAQVAPAGAVRPRGAPPAGAAEQTPAGPPPGAVRPRGGQ